MRKKILLITVNFIICYYVHGQINDCDSSKFRGIAQVEGIKHRGKCKGVNILLQDTCAYSNRFIKDFFNGQLKLSSKEQYLPAVIIDTALLESIESYLEKEICFNKIISLTNGHKILINEKSWVKYRNYFKLYIGAYDDEKKTTYIVVQLLTKKEYQKEPFYNKTVF